MNDSDDKIWQAVLTAEEPTAEELAQAEAELRELEPVAPLATAQVDAMVARATGAAAPRRGAGWPVRRLLAAALLMVSLVAAVSWFGRWEVRKQSLRGLEYADAVLMVTEAGYDDQDRLSALVVIDGICQNAARLLKEVSGGKEPSLAASAKRFRAEALELLATGAGRSPTPLNAQLTEWERRLRMEDLPITARETALEDIGRVLLEGARSMLYCRLQGPDAQVSRAAYIEFLGYALKD